MRLAVRRARTPSGTAKSRLPLRSDATLRRHVEMIVVIVTLQNQINRGQMLEKNARRAVPGRTYPGKRAGALRPDGITKNVQAFHLDQNVECPTKVARMFPSSTRSGGDRPRRAAIHLGQRPGLRVSSHLSRLPAPCGRCRRVDCKNARRRSGRRSVRYKVASAVGFGYFSVAALAFGISRTAAGAPVTRAGSQLLPEVPPLTMD